MAFFDDVSRYAHSEDDPDTTKLLISAAESYLNGAGIAENETNGLYTLAIGMLVSHWYDTRTPVAVGTVTKDVEYSLRGIIQQLQLCGGVG